MRISLERARVRRLVVEGEGRRLMEERKTEVVRRMEGGRIDLFAISDGS